VDSVATPDNLGFVLRRADAAGANSLHKNWIRASRGAVGRIPLACCSDAENYLVALIVAGFNRLAASSKTSKDLYDFGLTPPLAFVVGNDNEGIRIAIHDLCTDVVAIPRAAG